MFPPQVIGIVGMFGAMATNVVAPLFREAGYEVIGSDIKNPKGLNNREVVERADLVYFSILPINNVVPAMLELIPHAKPDTLWLHGTSIQNPVRAPITPVLLNQEITERRVDVGFLHFMVGPMVRSLRGQSIVYGFPRPLINPAWEEWLINLLTPKQPLLLKYRPELHDELTTGSQVIPQLMALVIGQLWKRQKFALSDILQMAGPPCWLQSYGILRNLSQKDIVASIVANHPNTRQIIREAVELLQSIDEACEFGRESTISRMAKDGLTVVSDAELEKIRQTIDWHIRLEGDMRGGAVCFVFSPEENRIGLLTQVLRVFDEQGLDKTSCMAQEVPGGGCMFYIGVKVDIDDPRVRAVCDQVTKELGGNMVAL